MSKKNKKVFWVLFSLSLYISSEVPASHFTVMNFVLFEWCSWSEAQGSLPGSWRMQTRMELVNKQTCRLPLSCSPVQRWCFCEVRGQRNKSDQGQVPTQSVNSFSCMFSAGAVATRTCLFLSPWPRWPRALRSLIIHSVSSVSSLIHRSCFPSTQLRHLSKVRWIRVSRT